VTIRYVITPYDPILWSDEELLEKYGEPVSDFKINLKAFLIEARKVWHITNTLTLMVDDEISLYFGFIDDQTMSIEIEQAKKFSEFIFWYRSYVPQNYELYLFREGNWQTLKLTKDTTPQDISAWTGRP
jgi:hypothetical protein